MRPLYISLIPFLILAAAPAAQAQGSSLRSVTADNFRGRRAISISAAW